MEYDKCSSLCPRLTGRIESVCVWGSVSHNIALAAISAEGSISTMTAPATPPYPAETAVLYSILQCNGCGKDLCAATIRRNQTLLFTRGRFVPFIRTSIPNTRKLARPIKKAGHLSGWGLRGVAVASNHQPTNKEETQELTLHYLNDFDVHC